MTRRCSNEQRTIIIAMWNWNAKLLKVWIRCSDAIYSWCCKSWWGKADKESITWPWPADSWSKL